MAKRCSAEVCSWLAAQLAGRVDATHAEALVAGVEVVLFGFPEPRNAANEDDVLAEAEAGEAVEAIINSEGESLEGLGADLRERWVVARRELRRSSFFESVACDVVAGKIGAAESSCKEVHGNVGEVKHMDKQESDEEQQREHQHQQEREAQEEEEWEQLAEDGVDDSASCIGSFSAACGPVRNVARQQQYGSQSCRGILSEPDLSPLCGDFHAEQVFNEMLAREQAFAGEWAVFYHTYTSPAIIYEVQAALATVLFNFGARCGALPRLLHAPFGDIPDATALLQAFPTWPDRDRNSAFKSVAICCATSLVSKDPQVTPTKVFRKGYNATVENLDMLESLIARCGPDLRRSEVKSIVRAIVAAGVQHKLPQATGESGLNAHLLQIFIRHSCVDKWAYASHPLGVPDMSRQPLSKTLASLGPICGQARLVVNPTVFMRASNVRLYAGSACKAFHENRPTFQKHLITLLRPILRSSHSRRQAVEGICNGAVPSWWRDPITCNTPNCSLALAMGSTPKLVRSDVHEESPLMEAIQASKVTFSEEIARRETRHDNAGSSTTYILKASAQSDMRRLTVRWPTGSSRTFMFDSICKDIRESFGLPEVGTTKNPLTYLDDEGDECTLVASTLDDFLTLSKGGVLKLRVESCVMPALSGGGVVASEEFSISTPRSVGIRSPKPLDIVYCPEIPVEVSAQELDFIDVEFTGVSADAQLEWTMLGTSGLA